MSDDNVWRTVSGHGPPDPAVHEWVWMSECGTLAPYPTLSSETAWRPDDTWAPVGSPPSAPPERWTVHDGWDQARSLFSCDGVPASYGEVRDLLNAAMRLAEDIGESS